MKRVKYSIKNLIKKGLSTLLSVCLIVSGVQTPVYSAEASIPTESTATVSGLVNKKVVLDLLSDDLREAALTAIRENRLFEAEDYLGATSDSAKAIKEYEAFFNRNPGLYVVEVPDSIRDILSGEADSELRIFIQKDEKKAKVDLEEAVNDESVLSRDVTFRYGTEDDIILYEPSSQIDTLVNGGEDAYYRDPEQDTADNSDYQLTGKEKITFMFVNASDGAVRYTLKVDGVKYDSVEVCGRTAALKHVLSQAGIKKTEETTAAAVETTAAPVEATVPAQLTNIGAALGTEEVIQNGENIIPEGTANDPSEMIGTMVPEGQEAAEPGPMAYNENDSTEAANPVTAEQGAAEIESGADTGDNNQGYIAGDTNTSQQGLTDNDTTEQTNDDAALVTDNGTAEQTNDDAALLTDNGTAEQTNKDAAEQTNDNAAELTDNDTEDNANIGNEDGAPAENNDTEDDASIGDQIAEAVQEAIENAGDAILGRMVAYADEIIGEGYVFEDEQQGPETEEEEKNEDIAAEAGNTEGNDNDAADKQEIQADLTDNNGTEEGGQQGGQEYGQKEGQQDGQEYGQEEGQQGGQEIGQQGEGLGTESLEQNDGSGAEIAGQNGDGSGNESNVTIVDIFTEDNQEEGVQNDTTSTEISTGDVPETAIEGTIPEGQMTLEDLTGMMAEPETTAAAEIQKPETTVKMPVASPSEVEETKGEYDEFAKALIEEVKQAVLEDKDAAKEQLKVAKIVQYSIGSLGKIHYLTEIDGYTVEVFAAQDAFGGFKPTLEVKRLYKPEENEGNGEAPTDAQIAELKANGIYDNSLLLDICFKNDAGDEVEPNGNVNVRMTLNDEELLKKIDTSSLEVHHIKDDNSTLKTEKVASTDDVKALDENDEQIDDSDLQAMAEAVAAGEEAEVEVASAVAEFEVESFSLFAITWKTNNYSVEQAEVNIFYYERYEEEGETKYKKILLNTNKESHNESGLTIELADYQIKIKDEDGNEVDNDYAELNLREWQGGVTGYDYVEALLGDVEEQGEKISINAVARKTKDGKNSLVFIKPDNSEVEFETNEKVQKTICFIYEKHDYPTGGYGEDPKPEDHHIEKEKKLTKNDDGTYKLTLSVTGQTEESRKSKHVNVVFVLDTSNSMSYDKEGNKNHRNYERLDIAKTASYEMVDELLGLNGKDGNDEDTVQMSFIRFGSSASEPTEVTTSADAVKAEIKRIAKNWKDGVDIPEGYLGLTQGTNWEDALIKANSVDFEDNDPVHIIFVSDGAPTARFSRNGYLKDRGYEGMWGFGAWSLGNSIKEASYEKSHEAAIRAAKDIKAANKTMYTIGAFPAGDELKKLEDLLIDEDHGSNYYEAKDADSLATAFADINKKIATSVGYTEVTVIDGITAYTASVDKVMGYVGDYTYEINDKPIEDDDVKAALEGTVKYDEEKQSVVWEFPDTITVNKGTENEKTKRFVLQHGYKYSVSFTVWPDQDSYDTLAKLENTYGDTPTDEAFDPVELYDPEDPESGGIRYYKDDRNFFYDTGKKIYYYKTNTAASVTYKVVRTNTETGEDDYVSDLSEPQPIYLSKDSEKGMSLDSTNISIEKIWETNSNYSQKNLIEKSAILLSLNYGKHEEDDDQNDDQNIFVRGISVGPNPEDSGERVFNGNGDFIGVKTTYEEGGETKYGIKWSNSRQIFIAPGILLTEDDAKEHGLDKAFKENDSTQVKPVTYEVSDTETNTYYMIETGHDYHFHEKNDNHKFTLDNRTYHPMLLHGDLYDVIFDSDGNIESMVSMGSRGSEKITAYNKFEYDDLKVYKMFKGNMAALQDAEFVIHLYNADGSTYYGTYTDGVDDIVILNTVEIGDKTVNKITLNSDNEYSFVIKPDKLGENKEITITLPKGVLYDIVEVNPGTDAGYTTYCGTSENPTAKGRSTDEINNNEKFILSGEGSVKTIYFINEKKAETPTGFTDNTFPFAVLALAGFAAMFFLACDFERKRLFEE